jgi:hypothetical protein
VRLRIIQSVLVRDSFPGGKTLVKKANADYSRKRPPEIAQPSERKAVTLKQLGHRTAKGLLARLSPAVKSTAGNWAGAGLQSGGPNFAL